MSDLKQLSVRGKALYLELKNERQTVQLVVHPDGISSDGTYVKFGTYHRVLNEHFPKRVWNHAYVSAVKNRSVDLDGPTPRPAVPAETDVYQATLALFRTHVDDILDQTNRQGYTLFKQPIVVEMSNVDFDEVQAEKTPYALFRRVMSARKALDFPESVLPIKL
jgi:hypothetical protein